MEINANEIQCHLGHLGQQGQKVGFCIQREETDEKGLMLLKHRKKEK